MNSYLLIKSLHLISVISWMAGLLYLPRIFVYHSENMNAKVIYNVFKTMERKLYYYIMTPAMVLSWFFGLILILIVGLETYIGNIINLLSFLFRSTFVKI
jgi:putative membrane protein